MHRWNYTRNLCSSTMAADPVDLLTTPFAEASTTAADPVAFFTSLFAEVPFLRCVSFVAVVNVKKEQFRRIMVAEHGCEASIPDRLTNPLSSAVDNAADNDSQGND